MTQVSRIPNFNSQRFHGFRIPKAKLISQIPDSESKIDIFGTGQTNIFIARQVQKSGPPFWVGSTRIDSDLIKKYK